MPDDGEPPGRQHRWYGNDTLGDRRSFLLQRAQPAMNGLIDGSLSTLATVSAALGAVT